MTGTQSVQAQSVPGSTLYGLYVMAIATTLFGNLLIGAEAGWLPPGGQVVMALASAAPLAAAALFFWKLLRRDLDEMFQRIVLEGLAFALVIYVPVAAIYVNLRTAGVWTPRLDAPDIIMTPALLVAIGVLLARRRLQ
jgi:hypothetical protein